MSLSINQEQQVTEQQQTTVEHIMPPTKCQKLRTQADVDYVRALGQYQAHTNYPG